MDTIKDIFSDLYELAIVITTVSGALKVITSSVLVKRFLAWVYEYFQLSPKIQPSKQPSKDKQAPVLSEVDLSAIFDSAFDKAQKAIVKGEVKQQPKNQMMDYLYILAVLIIIPLMLIFFLSLRATPPQPEIVSPPVNWASSGGMNIMTLLWMWVCIFGVIGFIRGWAKELLVIFSIMVALAVNALLVRYLPYLSDAPEHSISLFWVRVGVITVLGYLGYQMVSSIRLAREKLSDSLFGAAFGGLNGFLIVGSILAYFHKADYPYQNIIAPATDPIFLEKIHHIMAYLPPNLLGEPGIYIAVFLLLAFVVIVYV